MSKYTICGKPLEFGNKEQIQWLKNRIKQLEEVDRLTKGKEPVGEIVEKTVVSWEFKCPKCHSWVEEDGRDEDHFVLSGSKTNCPKCKTVFQQFEGSFWEVENNN